MLLSSSAGCSLLTGDVGIPISKNPPPNFFKGNADYHIPLSIVYIVDSIPEVGEVMLASFVSSDLPYFDNWYGSALTNNK